MTQVKKISLDTQVTPNDVDAIILHLESGVADQLNLGVIPSASSSGVWINFRDYTALGTVAYMTLEIEAQKMVLVMSPLAQKVPKDIIRKVFSDKEGDPVCKVAAEIIEKIAPKYPAFDIDESSQDSVLGADLGKAAAEQGGEKLLSIELTDAQRSAFGSFYEKLSRKSLMQECYEGSDPLGDYMIDLMNRSSSRLDVFKQRATASLIQITVGQMLGDIQSELNHYRLKPVGSGNDWKS